MPPDVPTAVRAIIDFWRTAIAQGALPTADDLYAALTPDDLAQMVLSTFDVTGNYVVAVPGNGGAQRLPAGLQLNREHSEKQRATLYRDYAQLHATCCAMWVRWRGIDIITNTPFQANSFILPVRDGADGKPRVATFHLFTPAMALSEHLRQDRLEQTTRRWVDLGQGIPFLPPRIM